MNFSGTDTIASLTMARYSTACTENSSPMKYYVRCSAEMLFAGIFMDVLVLVSLSLLLNIGMYARIFLLGREQDTYSTSVYQIFFNNYVAQ